MRSVGNAEEETQSKKLNTNATLILGQILARRFCFLLSSPASHLLIVSVPVSRSWMKLACVITEKNLIQKHSKFKSLNIFILNAN